MCSSKQRFNVALKLNLGRLTNMSCVNVLMKSVQCEVGGLECEAKQRCTGVKSRQTDEYELRHSLIIRREGLILTLSIRVILRGWIWCPSLLAE